MDSALGELVQQKQIPIIGIASADGFEHAPPGWYPKELIPTCKSVLVLGRPLVEHPLQVDDKTQIADESWWTANEAASGEAAMWRGGLARDTLGLSYPSQ